MKVHIQIYYFFDSHEGGRVGQLWIYISLNRYKETYKFGWGFLFRDQKVYFKQGAMTAELFWKFLTGSK